MISEMILGIALGQAGVTGNVDLSSFELIGPELNASVVAVQIGKMRMTDGPPVAFTCSKAVTGLIRLSDGGFAATTLGGLLVVKPSSGQGTKVLKFTLGEQLPSNELLGFGPGPQLTAESKLGSGTLPYSVISSPKWSVEGGQLKIEASKWSAPWEPSIIRGAALDGSTPMVALLGKGLMRWTGNGWTRDPGTAVFGENVTAVLSNAKEFVVGTSDRGCYIRRDGQWRKVIAPREIPDHDIQTIGVTQSALLVAGMEGAPFRIERQTLRVYEMPNAISRVRQMMPQGEGDWLFRSADGKFQHWQSPGSSLYLPWEKTGKKIDIGWSSCISGEYYNYQIGVEGGFWDYDGDVFTPYLKIPELKGQVITGVSRGIDDKFLIATQKKGLGLYNSKRKNMEWLSANFPTAPQWITKISSNYDDVICGTFNGKLIHVPVYARNAPSAPGEGTYFLGRASIVDLGDGSPVVWQNGWLAATRKGIYRTDYTSRDFQRLDLPKGIGEIQAIEEYGGYDNTWLIVGTRTGLYWFELRPVR